MHKHGLGSGNLTGALPLAGRAVLEANDACTIPSDESATALKTHGQARLVRAAVMVARALCLGGEAIAVAHS